MAITLQARSCRRLFPHAAGGLDFVPRWITTG